MLCRAPLSKRLLGRSRAAIGVAVRALLSVCLLSSADAERRGPALGLGGMASAVVAVAGVADAADGLSRKRRRRSIHVRHRREVSDPWSTHSLSRLVGAAVKGRCHGAAC